MHPGRTLTLPSGKKARVQIDYKPLPDGSRLSTVLVTVLENDVPEDYLSASARCSVQDNFSRRLGRKLAMQRIMEACGDRFDKADRAALWAVVQPKPPSLGDRLISGLQRFVDDVATKLKAQEQAAQEAAQQGGEHGQGS